MNSFKEINKRKIVVFEKFVKTFSNYFIFFDKQSKSFWFLRVFFVIVVCTI